MLDKGQIEGLFENIKGDIRKDAARNDFNLYNIGYYNALNDVLTAGLKEAGGDFWQKARKGKIGASQDSKCRRGEVLRQGGEGRSAE